MGNIYERLDDARRKRERLLDTPPAANRAKPPFPRLKAPLGNPTVTDAPRRGPGWMLPVLLALAIFGVIFVFAVA